jgi:hypothetical protein
MRCEMSNSNIIHEDKHYKVTFMEHVNGTITGRIINKFDKESFGWARFINNRIKIPELDLPDYIYDVIDHKLKEINNKR